MTGFDAKADLLAYLEGKRETLSWKRDGSEKTGGCPSSAGSEPARYSRVRGSCFLVSSSAGV